MLLWLAFCVRSFNCGLLIGQCWSNIKQVRSRFLASFFPKMQFNRGAFEYVLDVKFYSGTAQRYRAQVTDTT